MYRQRYGYTSSSKTTKTTYSRVGGTTSSTSTTVTRTYGDKQSCGPKGLDRLPRSLQNKAKFGRRRRRSAPTLRTRFTYGPVKDKSRAERLWRRLRDRLPDVVAAMEEREKEKEEEEAESRLPDKELEKLPTLLVKKVRFHMQPKAGPSSQPKVAPCNGKAHHTDKYACTKGKDAQAVLRRGQEFRVTFTFNRPYNKEQDDLVFIFEADDEKPGKNLRADFKLDEERKKAFSNLPHWAARIKTLNPDKCSMKLAIYIPNTCVIGEWDLKVKTALRGKPQDYVYEHPKPIIVLFNPWCSDDQVHYTEDKKDLKEYVLNDKGSAYYGSANYVQSRPWTYGQFDADILQISLSLLKQAFGFKMSAAMADPIKVSRALSKIVNSCDDDGVLVGNWSGEYEGGTSPTKWDSSVDILKQFDDKGCPVQFGQCWVFSHVLTAVCRALGIPCRSVTNFDSAHDTDNSCTVDCYYNEEGEELKSMKKDSIWNFHVWNEVWIMRPDIEKHDCHGWHAIDATPQEQSEGSFQCGPSPVKAVKNGLIKEGYDTAFIFAEVNSDVVHWICKDNGELVSSALKKKSVGSRLSTKPADGKPHVKSCTWWNMDDPEVRMDLTSQYKHQEGTEEEREAVKRAVRTTYGVGAKLYQESAELEVDFEKGEMTMVGEALRVGAVVRNRGEGVKTVDMLMTARSSSYSNDSDSDRQICKEKMGTRTIRPGAEERFEVTIPSALYSAACDDAMTVYMYARAMDTANNMPHTAQQPFKMGIPDIEVQGPEESRPGEAVTLRVTLSNPLDTPLTSVMLQANGDFRDHPDSPNPFESFFWNNFIRHRDLKPKETVTLELKMYWEEEPAEEDEEEDDPSDDEEEAEEEEEEEAEDHYKTESFELQSAELTTMTGSFCLKCCKH